MIYRSTGREVTDIKAEIFLLTKHGLEKMFEIILDCRVQNKITAFSLNL